MKNKLLYVFQTIFKWFKTTISSKHVSSNMFVEGKCPFKGTVQCRYYNDIDGKCNSKDELLVCIHGKED